MRQQAAGRMALCYGNFGMGHSHRPGLVIVADGTRDAIRRLKRMMRNDPASAAMRHTDAGDDSANFAMQKQIM